MRYLAILLIPALLFTISCQNAATEKATFCEPELKEGDQRLWIKDQQQWLVLHEKGQLELLDGISCQLIASYELNAGADPRFAEILYNETSRLVGIKGKEQIWCFDLNDRQLYAPIRPNFAELDGRDAEAPIHIQRLELWESFMIGYASPKGFFAFNLEDPASPQAVNPVLEVRGEDDHFRSLFLLPSQGQEEKQPILPTYHSASNTFHVNPMLDFPRMVEVALAPDAPVALLNIREANQDSRIAVNLSNQKRINIPPDLSEKDPNLVWEWLSEQY